MWGVFVSGSRLGSLWLAQFAVNAFDTVFVGLHVVVFNLTFISRTVLPLVAKTQQDSYYDVLDHNKAARYESCQIVCFNF